MKQAESPQGEPFSSYFIGTPGTTVIVPSAMLDLPIDARAGAGRIAFAPFEGPRVWIRGAIAEVVEKRGSRKTRTLATAEETLKRRFAGAEIPFRWVRLAELPTENSAAALLAAVEATEHGFGTPRWETVAGGAVTIVAAVFKEEVRQGEHEDTWLFVVRVRTEAGVSAPPREGGLPQPLRSGGAAAQEHAPRRALHRPRRIRRSWGRLLSSWRRPASADFVVSISTR